MTRPSPRPPLDEFTARRVLRELTGIADRSAEGYARHMAERGFAQPPLTVEWFTSGDSVYLACRLQAECCNQNPCPLWDAIDPHSQALVDAWRDWYAAGVIA